MGCRGHAQTPCATNGEHVLTRLIELAGKRIAIGKDFDPATGKLSGANGVRLVDEALAAALTGLLRSMPFTVESVNEKPFTQRPQPPFITSSLQQEAARKLRFGVQHTMRVAQSLYENGYITYMRTDSTQLSTQAVDAARAQAADLYGRQYVPDAPRHYAAKAKGAQEAHEAIRPAGATFRTPRELEGELRGDEFRLYDLIWKRTLACQMKDAIGSRTTVRFVAPAGEHGQATFSASGKVISFDGFLRAYVQGSDEAEGDLPEEERVLPPLRQGDTLDPKLVEPKKHTTTPPPRYTEATLIRELEERGIGRPSTYATIIQTIQDRGYVGKKGTALVPTWTAFAVVRLLEKHFDDLVDFDFTAKMEDDLDAIASGKLLPTPWLQAFYFGSAPNGTQGQDLTHVGLKRRISSGGENIDAREISTIPLGNNEDGQPVVVRVGRYGPYIQVGDSEQRANIPEDTPPDEVNLRTAAVLLARSKQGPQVLGQDPQTGKPVYLKAGRFGPYVQLGDPEPAEKRGRKRSGKPKMASLWPSMKPETLTLPDALTLLSFPRTLGNHPQTGEPVTVQDGRFGPYVKMGDQTRSLADHQQLKTIALDAALALLAQPKSARRAAGAGQRPGGRQAPRQRGHHRAQARPLRPLRHRRHGQRLPAQGHAAHGPHPGQGRRVAGRPRAVHSRPRRGPPGSQTPTANRRRARLPNTCRPQRAGRPQRSRTRRRPRRARRLPSRTPTPKQAPSPSESSL